MEIPKPTEQDKAYFSSLVPSDPLVEVKPMFGNLGAFVNGNMFMGLFGAAVGVKLDSADQATLLGEKGAGPFGPEGHRMAGYVSLPAAWRSRPAKAEVWVAKALAGAAGLPPKVKAPRKSTATQKPVPESEAVPASKPVPASEAVPASKASPGTSKAVPAPASEAVPASKASSGTSKATSGTGRASNPARKGAGTT
jgi:TfoX/Sxy family transcriptional regulator of competence genes